MSGFDTHWLDLREPVDHAARDAGLLRAAAQFLRRRAEPLAVDLGCGTGSTARAFAPHLPAAPRWRLVDNDRKLLAEARLRLGDEGIQCVEADLQAIDALPLDDADLVTASALFDLVSRDWLERLAARLSAAGIGLYSALNYDGRMEFETGHAADRAIVEAFNRHQRGDKGFGPALGPDSATALGSVLEDAGFAVEAAESPWQFGPGPLAREFVEGVAAAVRETGFVPERSIADWVGFRHAAAGRILVGHRDVLALPHPTRS